MVLDQLSPKTIIKIDRERRIVVSSPPPLNTTKGILDMSNKSTITVEYLRSILDYDPETGIFTWKHRKDVPKEWNTRFCGKKAGGNDKKGRTKILINGKQYRTNILAWFYIHGSWPNKKVDHIDRDSFNDKINNLRLATSSQNAGNSKISKTNTTGLKGVCRFRSRWRAQIRVNGPKIWLGDFNCPAAASFAYQISADIYFGEFVGELIN